MTETPETRDLRDAARMMRLDADAATGGTWQHMCMGSEGCLVSNDGKLRDRKRIAFFGEKEWLADHADAGYVTSMQPGVGRMLADLLDKLAWMGELDPEQLGRVGCDEAIAVARAYLATKSPKERMGR
jgi:hypothetical protein